MTLVVDDDPRDARMMSRRPIDRDALDFVQWVATRVDKVIVPEISITAAIRLAELFVVERNRVAELERAGRDLLTALRGRREVDLDARRQTAAERNLRELLGDEK